MGNIVKIILPFKIVCNTIYAISSKEKAECVIPKYNANRTS
jgi:hypothetical protein